MQNEECRMKMEEGSVSAFPLLAKEIEKTKTADMPCAYQMQTPSAVIIS